MEKDYKKIEIDIPKEKNAKIQKIISIIRENKEKTILFIQFSLVGVAFFGLGTLYEQNQLLGQKSLKIGQNERISAIVSQYNSNINKAGSQTIPNKENLTSKNVQFFQNLGKSGEFLFVASKNGKTYYKISCKNRIKEENKIYLKTEENAQKMGLRRSKTCFK